MTETKDVTKQEEIREAIDLYVDDECTYLAKDCKWRAKEGYCVSDDDSYICLMERFTELGVVIKVDRELPNPPKSRTDWHSDFRSLDEDDLMLYRDGQGSMLNAGYVAVDSLIEECVK